LEVTVATVFFLLLPIVSQLKAEKVYLSQGYFDDLRTILILFLAQIAALLAAMYLQYFPPAVPREISQLSAQTFLIMISVTFFVTVTMALRIGYRLLSKIVATGE
jgi:hypothetical protein